MAYTTPTTAGAGVIQTAAIWNASVRDNILYLADRVDNPPRAFAYNSGVQSIASGSDTAVALDSEFFDTAALHSTSVNTSRITIPSGQSGWWLFTGRVEFAASATGQRKLMLRLGGATEMTAVQVDAAAGASVTKLPIAFLWPASAGEYYELIVSQNSGGALNLSASPYFLAQRIA